MSEKPGLSMLPVQVELIARKIYVIGGQRVMLDADLAELYQVETKNLNKAVRRNLERFPPDFMFQMTKEQADCLRFQFGTSKEGRGGRRYLPYAFTEHGVAMLSSVLRSERAVQMNILIVRAFIQLRDLFASNKEVAAKLGQIEAKLRQHDAAITLVIDEIKKLKAVPEPRPKVRIGFVAGQGNR